MKINELMALRVQEFLWCEYSLLVAVQDLQKAMETRAEFEDATYGTVTLKLTDEGRSESERYRSAMQQGAKLGGEVKAGEDKDG